MPGGFGGLGGPGESGMIPTTPTGSRVEIFQADTVVTLSGEFLWKPAAYNDVLQTVLGRTAAQVRGKMALFSGDSTIFAFADRPDGRPGVMKRMAQQGPIPQGAVERELNSSRSGLPYPPDQRFSFFVSLLPFMENKGKLIGDIYRDKPWYATENRFAAQTWVPELLVPDYPASAWRATSELIPDGGAVGGTNYVGVAGVGLDAARFDPRNPDHFKKVGLLGYEFGSKPEDVKDGLSNTMYLIQVPPGMQRPWISGGGATLMGVDDQGTDPARPFLSKRADGSRTTTVLMGDGSVRTVREGIDPTVFRGMATRAGGETIPDLEKAAPKQKPGGTSELTGTK